MQIEWKKVKNGDGSEALFGAFRVNSLEEASIKTRQAVKIIKSHRDDKYSHMSLSHEGLTIMLHGILKQKIGNNDWAIAEEIRKSLSD